MNWFYQKSVRKEFQFSIESYEFIITLIHHIENELFGENHRQIEFPLRGVPVVLESI